ncbi:plasmid transfer protein TraA [Streptomyces gibsoniae]|uniref:Plasmid transfer protein TraA n=1 Tax=Streptomyces gibsoniae TaxID=3075529 RepID=A0ABU2U925_9ACTN|nr:plasmid transfer protein TraA [Streptomyces sp. DSM 41699]MDT0469678.1 plasmid transfer protein TraA [Streptomyces sp. DSM 41699]
MAATSSVPPQANGAHTKVGMTKNSSYGFAPSFGLNVTVQADGRGGKGGRGNGGAAAGGQPGGGGSHFILGEPAFNNTEDVRNYCNHVRALMLQAAIELAMASKILEARLAQAQTLPGDSIVQGRMRAMKVSRKLKKAADGATAAAKSAVGAYGAFQREYADLMRPRPQRAATTNPFKF